MNLPIEIQGEPYVRDVLLNTALEDLPDEKWVPVENFDGYALSNYGRLKSLERKTPTYNGGERGRPEIIMRLVFPKNINKYLNQSFFNVHSTLGANGRKYRKSIPRLVYYHFVEKFDLHDRTIVISFKDGNSLNVHVSNLEKCSAHERQLKSFRDDHARNRRVHYLKPVSQYSVEGEWIADFDSLFDASKQIGVGCESILDVINKEFLTAGGFRWFLKSAPPKEDDFVLPEKNENTHRTFNTMLWKNVGQPSIDFENLPGCFNLSNDDMVGEEWRPLPGFEGHFAVSTKGRVKRLSGWTKGRKKFFIRTKILSQMEIKYNKTVHGLVVRLCYNGTIIKVDTRRLLYCAFIQEFDIHDKTQMIVDDNESLWDIDVFKLRLLSRV